MLIFGGVHITLIYLHVCTMKFYLVLSYIDHVENCPNVGNYTTHWVFGWYDLGWLSSWHIFHDRFRALSKSSPRFSFCVQILHLHPPNNKHRAECGTKEMTCVFFNAPSNAKFQCSFGPQQPMEKWMFFSAPKDGWNNMRIATKNEGNVGSHGFLLRLQLLVCWSSWDLVPQTLRSLHKPYPYHPWDERYIFPTF